MAIDHFKFCDYEKRGNVVVIILNRPDRLNALGKEVLEGIFDACQKFENDHEARVAILTGTGRAFSAGADLKEMSKLKPGQSGLLPIREGIDKVTKPVIAAINGIATGGGFLLMMGCDIRIASESASFGMAEVKVAIPGGPQGLLAEGITLSAAMELVLIGDLVTAQRAYDMGLINKVVPAEELLPTAMRIAQRITELPPRITSSIRQAKAKAIDAHRKTFGVAERSPEEQAQIFASEDHKETVRAFTEKRKPVFK